MAQSGGTVHVYEVALATGDILNINPDVLEHGFDGLEMAPGVAGAPALTVNVALLLVT